MKRRNMENKKLLKEMGERIKKRREMLHYTQEEVAEMVDLTSSSYSKIENGFQGVSLESFIRIAKSLDLSLDYIVFGTKIRHKDELTTSDYFRTLMNYVDSIKLNHAAVALEKLSEFKEMYDADDSVNQG